MPLLAALEPENAKLPAGGALLLRAHGAGDRDLRRPPGGASVGAWSFGD